MFNAYGGQILRHPTSTVRNAPGDPTRIPRADVSTTVFLSRTNTGGELTIETPFGAERQTAMQPCRGLSITKPRG